MYHEYTSAAGGKIFFPLSCSRFRNLFRSKNSLVSTSSFNCASQLSSKVAISNAKRSFCSGVSFSTHFCLSNFTAGAVAAALDVKSEAVVFSVEVVGWADGSPEAVGEEEDKGDDDEAVEATAVAGFAGAEGDEKKEVMLALAFGFFLVVEVAISAALRLSGVAMTTRLKN